MISRIHSKLGTAGLVVAIVALVVALTGVAFAATGLNGKQKKEVKKIAKKYAGKQGPVGPQGPAGPAGKDGSNGTNGSNGTDGTDGVDGKSVVLTTEAAGANCSDGGTKVEVAGTPASKKYVCNGETGFTETLPVAETETGTWAVGSQAGGATIIPLTFNIPLPEAPDALHYVNDEGEERIFGPVSEEIENVPATICLGSVEEPTAPAGEVCVYAQEEEVAAFPGYLPVGGFRHLYVSGATFLFSLQAGDFALGTWAVTAE
jgi:hypothetical protein